MRILFGFIVVILRFFILIGDCFLFVCRLPLILIQKLLNLRKKTARHADIFVQKKSVNFKAFFLKLKSRILNIILAIASRIRKIIYFLFHLPLAFFQAIFKIIARITIPKTPLPRFPSLKFLSFKFPVLKQDVAGKAVIDLELKKHKKKKEILISPYSFAIKIRFFLYGILFSLFFVFLPLLFFIFLQELPNPRLMVNGQIPQTTKIYDRNGILLYQIYASQNRTIIPLNTIPKNLQNATIAIEDKDFYKHPGFDLAAIARSFIKNISTNQLQGGSTITQQLIKSALLSPETKIERKIKELILAFWSERIYSKNQILELYFNQVPYGGTAWGVEAASQTYFGKHVKDLDFAECAFLAGIPKAPTIYSPYGQNPNLWKERQKEVLGRMVDLGYTSLEEAKKAENEELVFKEQQVPIYAPHFVMYVKDYLTRKYGLSAVEKGGLNVITSLDLKKQEMAQKIVSDEVANDAYLNLTNGASLITDPKNGDVLAMIGSKDYQEANSGNVNVTTSLRQPGSSIKVVTYAKALSLNFTNATILDDSPISFTSPGAPSYTPVNYDGKSHGRVPLRIAFANSFNITAVKVLNQIGVENMIALARKMGVKSWSDPKRYGLSLTLGGGDLMMTELATIYGTVANKGVRVDLNPVLKITDYKGNVLEEKNNPSGIRALDEGVAYLISSILSDDNARSWAFGSNSLLNIKGKTVSVKTGTSDNKKDNWTVGYTPSYVVTVWVGNNDSSPMSQTLASGITGAAPIWNKIMTNLLINKPDEKYEMPSNVVSKPCLGRTEYFIKGTENSVSCVFVPSPTITVSPTP